VSLARDGAQQLVRLHAVWALGQIARKVRSAVAPLASLLAHADSEVRAQAAKLLGELRAREAHDRLVELLRDPEPRVRFFAATALSKVVQPGDVQPLCDLLLENNDADANIRHGAVLGLAGLRKPQSLLPAAAHSSAAFASVCSSQEGGWETPRWRASSPIPSRRSSSKPRVQSTTSPSTRRCRPSQGSS
jgi:HEAT repeat protein